MTCKNRPRYDLYVFGGTLNLAQLYSVTIMHLIFFLGFAMWSRIVYDGQVAFYNNGIILMCKLETLADFLQFLEIAVEYSF